MRPVRQLAAAVWTAGAKRAQPGARPVLGHRSRVGEGRRPDLRKGGGEYVERAAPPCQEGTGRRPVFLRGRAKPRRDAGAVLRIAAHPRFAHGRLGANQRRPRRPAQSGVASARDTARRGRQPGGRHRVARWRLALGPEHRAARSAGGASDSPSRRAGVAAARRRGVRSRRRLRARAGTRIARVFGQPKARVAKRAVGSPRRQPLVRGDAGGVCHIPRRRHHRPRRKRRLVARRRLGPPLETDG